MHSSSVIHPSSVHIKIFSRSIKGIEDKLDWKLALQDHHQVLLLWCHLTITQFFQGNISFWLGNISNNCLNKWKPNLDFKTVVTLELFGQSRRPPSQDWIFTYREWMKSYKHDWTQHVYEWSLHGCLQRWHFLDMTKKLFKMRTKINVINDIFFLVFFYFVIHKWFAIGFDICFIICSPKLEL